MKAFLLALFVFSAFAQEEMTNPSVGIQYKHFPNAAKKGAVSSIGVNLMGNLFPEDFTTVDYNARIGAVTAGNVDGKKFLDVDLELGISQVLIARATYKNNPNLHSVGGIVGLGLGHGDEVMGTGGFLGFEFIFNKEFRNTFIENNIQDIEYNVTTFKQNANDVIISESQLSGDQLVNLNPDSFTATNEVKKFDHSKLKHVFGSGASFYGTLIPIGDGAVSFSGKVRYVQASAETDKNNTMNFDYATGTKKVDVGGGILVDKNYHVYSNGQGSISDVASESYTRLDVSLQLAYSKAKIRIWVEPSYTQNNLEIVKNALNLKSVTQKNFGFTVGLNYHLFKYLDR